MPESSFGFLQNGHEPLNCLGVVVGEEEAFAAIQGFNSSHIFRCQCEIEKVKILLHTILMNRFWNDDDITLEQEAKGSLRSGLASEFPGNTISSAICQNEEVMQYLEQEVCDIGILPFPVAMEKWDVREYMKEHLFVCVPIGHELAGHKELYFEELNGFNFLLRSELGFWDTLCREKMPASKFLVQTDTSVFDELVKASSLPCFTTDYISDWESAYPNRVCVPIMDAAANVTFYLVTKRKCK